MEKKKNKITYGFKNVHCALVTETPSEDGVSVTYGNPVKIPGGVSANLSKVVTNTPIPADDDDEYAMLTDNKGYDGDVTFLDVPEEFLIDFLGMKKLTDGSIVENKEDKPKPFALLFEIAGDAQKRRRCFYRCTATAPNVTTQTKDGTTVNNATVAISARPAKDTGDIQKITPEGSDAYADFYKTVPVSEETE